MRLFNKRRVLVLIVLGLFGAAGAWYFQRENGQAASFRTAVVERGDLLVSISATGTVEPVEVVDVGAQVAGRILSFGLDADGKTVDYGSMVSEGTVLARIDDSLYAADEAQAEALVQSANAGVQVAKADLEQLKAKLHQAERDWLRAQKLGPSDALSQASYDAYKSAYETARANVTVGEAAILQAEAAVAQAQATLRRTQRNLGYCTITSPVRGVIIDRRVNIGQTVVASLNAPSLFLIAKDLTRMQVWVAVNEADISKIHPGQPVTFTVDAFSGETFSGEVGKVRLNASMTQNVVTYTVEITTDNSNGRLLPYLTANVQFELNRGNNVLLAPNGALRWEPSVDQIAPKFRDAFENPEADQPSEGERRSTSRSPEAASEVANAGVLWVIEGQQVRPLRVRTGLTDGSVTEVQGEELKEGIVVVTGLQSQDTAQSDTGSPFTPKFPRSKAGSFR
ncbi:MAG: efflux RND transporter periplasmic adaptor subunit [Thermodesulfobacteriota bacterium]